MPLPTTVTELEIMLNDVQEALWAAQAAAKLDTETRRAAIGSAISSLEGLLGVEGSAPYDPATGANATINGVLAHDTEDHAVLAQNAGLALSLILNAMKIDVGAGLNAFRVIANN